MWCWLDKVLLLVHCCVPQISSMEGTALYPPAMNVDDIDTYSPGAVVSFQRSDGSIVSAKILGPSEPGADYRSITDIC